MQVLLMVFFCLVVTCAIGYFVIFAGNISVSVLMWSLFGLMVIIIACFAFNWKKFCYKMPDPEGLPDDGEIIEGEIVE